MDRDQVEKLLNPTSKSGKTYIKPSHSEIIEILGDEADEPHGNTEGIKFAKIDPEELITRRSKVQKLVMRGVHKDEIAKFLGIHIKTVYADLVFIKKSIRKNVMQLDYPLFVGETMAFYDEVKQISLRMATNPAEKDKKIKLAALREATNAEDSKHRFLTQAGMYKAVNPDQVYSSIQQSDDVSMQDVLKSIESKLANASGDQMTRSFDQGEDS